FGGHEFGRLGLGLRPSGGLAFGGRALIGRGFARTRRLARRSLSGGFAGDRLPRRRLAVSRLRLRLGGRFTGDLRGLFGHGHPWSSMLSASLFLKWGRRNKTSNYSNEVGHLSATGVRPNRHLQTGRLGCRPATSGARIRAAAAVRPPRH